jgi:hypothetical protein
VTSSVVDPAKARAGDLIGYRKDGRPIYLLAGGHTNPNFAQVGFRGRAGDTVTLNGAFSGGDPALNTNWSQDADVVFRVRFAVEENAGGTGAAGGTIEANLNGGSFQAITTTSSIVKAVASSQFADDATTTDLGVGGAGGFVSGRGSETGDPTDVTLTSQHTEFEYALQIVGADVANGDTIVIRLAGLNSYTVAGPSLTVTGVVTPPVDVDAALTVTAGITAEGSAPAPAGAWGSSVTTWGDAGRTWTGDVAGGGTTVEIDAALTVTAGVTADAMRFADVDAALGVSAGITAAANLTPSVAAASLGVDAGITATADVIGTVPPVEIDAALGITATPTGGANNTAVAEASLQVTAAPTTGAERIAGVEGQLGLTAAVQAAGALTPAAADTTLNITAGVSAEADVVGSVTVDATRGITATVTAAATSTTVAGADLAAAVTITADAAVIHAAGANLEITADASADAAATIPAEATLIITADLAVTATVPGPFVIDENPLVIIVRERSPHVTYQDTVLITHQEVR